MARKKELYVASDPLHSLVYKPVSAQRQRDEHTTAWRREDLTDDEP
jgi:hypothetical protein